MAMQTPLTVEVREPLPGRISNTAWVIKDAKMHEICRMALGYEPLITDIIRACNAHDELVAKLQACIDAHDKLPEGYNVHPDLKEWCRVIMPTAIREAREYLAAIAKAEAR